MRTDIYDSRKRLFTKKVRGIDITTAGKTAQEIHVLYRPQTNRRFVLLNAVTTLRKKTGTITTPASLTVDDGTAGHNMITAISPGTTEGAVVKHAIAATNYFIANDMPLSLNIATAAAGATVAQLDIVFTFIEI